MKRSFPSLSLLLLFTVIPSLPAIEITNEDLATSRVFSSGFEGAPVRNGLPGFVGAGYDLSVTGWLPGTGWDTRVHNLTMISPLHFATANHFSYNYFDPGTELSFVSASSQKVTRTVQAIHYGVLADTSIGLVETAFAPSQQVGAARVLDVSSRSYGGMAAIAYGSDPDGVGPRVGNSQLNSPTAWAGAGTVNRAEYWEGGDSGSPIFLPYIAQDGTRELTLAGTAWFPTGIGTLLPYGSTDTITPVNALLKSTGYALKWTIYDNPADPARTAARWNGAGVLSAAASWSGGVAPANLPAVFSSTSGMNTTVVVDQAFSLRGLLFTGEGTQDAFSFTGSPTLTVGTSGIRNQSTATQVFHVPIALDGSQNWEAERGDLVFQGSLSTGAGHLLVIGGARDTTLNGTVSGSGGLAKDDAGVLTLNAAATYTGTTFLHNGTVQLGTGGQLGAGALAFVASGGALLNLNGQNQTLGEISSSYGGTGRILLGGATLNVSTTASGTAVYLGTVEGAGQVVKSGTGTWSTAGTDIHAGGTRIDGGALRVLSEGALSASSNLALNGGVLELGAGNFTRELGAGAGQVQFTADGGFSAYGGTRVVNIGGAGETLTWGAGSFLATGKHLILSSGNANATVEFQNSLSMNGGDGTFRVLNGSAAMDARITGTVGNGTLVKAGAGALELTGNNTYAGATIVHGGALVASSSGALGTGNLHLNGGVLGLANGDFTRALETGAGQVRFAQWGGVGGGFAAYGADRFVDIGGAGAVLTWGSAQFLPFGTKLILSDASASATVDFRNGLDLAGAERTIEIGNGAAAVDARLSGSLVNGAVLVSGPGVLELSGTNTFSGTLRVNGQGFTNSGGVLASSESALGTGNLRLENGGMIVLGHSDFTRAIGTGAGEVQLPNSAGFAAHGADRAVNIGGDLRQLTWGVNGFLANGETLTLSSVAADATLSFQNAINLNGAEHYFHTQNGSAAVDARLTGVLSNGSLTKTGDGTLELTGNNTYSGTTRIRGGILRLGSPGAITAFSNIDIGNGGVLELAAGDLARSLGTGPGKIQFTSNGGFSAVGADRTVTLNDGAILVWGSTGLPNWQDTLILSSASADHTIILANPIKIRDDAGGTGMRTLQVNNGSADVDARITGNLTIGNKSLWGVEKTGAGTLELTGTVSYNGGTLISAGTLIVAGALTVSDVTVRENAEFRYTGAGSLNRTILLDGGVFCYNSAAAFTGSLIGSGTIAGSGDLGVGALTVGMGRTLAPGNSTGTLTTGAQTWEDGGTYLWEISSLSGTQGGDPGWDFLSINGTLDILAGTGGFTLELDALGPLAGWDASSNSLWTIATATDGITRFLADRFVIDASGFAAANALQGGQFQLAVSGNNLNLHFIAVPEPTIGVLAGIGVGLLLARQKARQR